MLIQKSPDTAGTLSLIPRLLSARRRDFAHCGRRAMRPKK
jgi:hypothetical protein